MRAQFFAAVSRSRHAPRAQPASMARARCAVSDKLCEVLVNQHVAAEKIGPQSAVLDDDEFVEEFSSFLASLATHTQRVIGSRSIVPPIIAVSPVFWTRASCYFFAPQVNAGVVTKAVAKELKIGQSDAQKFGHQAAKALAWAHAKGLSATSGKKLTHAVRAVLLSFKDSRLEKIQGLIKGSGALKRGSSASSSSHKTPRSDSAQDHAAEPPGTPPETGSASASAVVDLDPHKIRAMYGMTPPRKGAKPFIKDSPEAVLSVASSPPEVVSSPEKEGSKAPMWYDFNAGTAHRFSKDGKQIDGILEAGTHGFCRAVFNAVVPRLVLETEVPNLVLEKAAQGKAKVAMRRPAAAVKKKPAAAPVDDEGEAEDGAGDEGGEEEGEEEEDEEAVEEHEQEAGPPQFDVTDMPKELGGRATYMGATITRKDKKMKVHLAKRYSNNGKECDVELMFGNQKTDVEAYKAAKAYIYKRAKRGIDVD